MTFRAEPYGVFVDDLVSGLTGGVVRERFVFAPEEMPYQLGARAQTLAATARIHGLLEDTYHRFRNGIDFAVDDIGVITWRPAEDAADVPAPGAVWPDLGSVFWASYERRPDPAAPPLLTDRNPGSVTRTLAESFAREYSVLSLQLEQVYDAAFLDTATGRDLDAVVSLLGVTRRSQRFARGEVVFSRSSPAAGDIHVPIGTQVSTADAPVVTVETIDDATLRRGTLSVAVAVQALIEGAPGVAAAGALRVVHRPILGVETVANPEPLTFASAAETDDALRRRARLALDAAGRSTVRAVIGALTTVEGIREQDVRVDEDHNAHPGVVKVTVAAELEPGRAEQAARVLEDARPAGVRFIHNLVVVPPPVEVVGPGGGAVPGPVPATVIEDPLWFPIGVKAVVTPDDADLKPAQKSALRTAVEGAIDAFVGALGVGEAVVYNRLVSAILDVPGAFDVVLDIAPAGATPAGRQNLFPDPPRLRPRLDHLDVSVRGALVALDVTVEIERRGLAAALDPTQALANARDNISNRLATMLPTLAGVIDQPVLFGLLDPTEDYVVEELHYTAEFIDEGLRVVGQDRPIDPTDEEQPWLRSVIVTEATQG
jgi:uncharacterized phage protein gp47/JayE